MPRDRLADLQRAREGARTSIGSSFRRTCRRVTTIQMDQADGDDTTGLFSQIEDVKVRIADIEDEVERVKKLQSAILSSPVPDTCMQEQLDQLMSTIRRSSNGVRTTLKEMESALKQEEEEATRKNPAGVAYINADIRMRKTQHAALSTQFVDTMTVYQTAQADYRDRCKGRIKRHLDIVGSELSDDEVEKMMEEGNWSVFTSDIMKETAEAKQTLADVQARYNDMIKLEKSIRELQEMFMEMAGLVQTQGGLINQIESHVSNAQGYVESGTKKLRTARKYQGDARKKKIWIIIIVVVIVVVIGLIIYFSSK